MPPHSRRHKKKSGQTVAVISFSILAIGAMVVVSLFMGGTLTWEMFGFGGDDSGYRNITLTDAQFVCEQEARKEYNGRIKTLTVDSLSSRYDQKSNRYKMFFDLDMSPKGGDNKSIPEPHFLNCFVHGSRGTVTHFESVENKEDTAKPIRKTEGNIFGF